MDALEPLKAAHLRSKGRCGYLARLLVGLRVLDFVFGLVWCHPKYMSESLNSLKGGSWG